MKKTLLSLLTVLIAFVTLMFISCGKEEDDSLNVMRYKIVGRWHITYPSNYMTYTTEDIDKSTYWTFQSDGTCMCHSSTIPEYIETYTLTKYPNDGYLENGIILKIEGDNGNEYKFYIWLQEDSMVLMNYEEKTTTNLWYNVNTSVIVSGVRQ